MIEVPGGRRGAPAQNDLSQIVEDLLPVPVKRTAVGHDHVQLPGDVCMGFGLYPISWRVYCIQTAKGRRKQRRAVWRDR